MSTNGVTPLPVPFEPGQFVDHRGTGRRARVVTYNGHHVAMTVQYLDCSCFSSVDPYQMVAVAQSVLPPRTIRIP